MNIRLSAAIAVAGLTVAGCSSFGASNGAPVTSSGRTVAPVVAPPPSSSSQYLVPVPSDYTVTVKVLTKQCFGTAGCDLTYRTALAWNLSAVQSPDPSITYDVTYEVDGGDSGPQVGTFQVTGNQYSDSGVQVISTTTQGQQLTAKVTDVSQQ